MSIKKDNQSNLKKMGELSFYGGSIGLVAHWITGLDDEPHLAPVLFVAIIFGAISIVIYLIGLKKISYSVFEKRILLFFLVIALASFQVYILKSYNNLSNYIFAVICGTVINFTSAYHCFKAIWK